MATNSLPSLREGPEFEFQFEYVNRATSEMLLDKFPDMSAYDFNYAESAIWSPLHPRLYNCTTTFLSAEIKPKKKKQQKQHGNSSSRKLTKRFFKKRISRFESSFTSTQKAQAWSRLLRVASRCFKGGRPSLSSSMRLLNLPREIIPSDSLQY